MSQRPRKSKPVRSILHTKIQTYPQLLREMQQTRRLLILMTIWAYLERFFVHGHSLVRSFYPFFIHICSFLFISYILLPAFFRLSYVFTLHWCTWCIGALGALVHLVHWRTWCIGALGALVHWCTWCTWCIGALGAKE